MKKVINVLSIISMVLAGLAASLTVIVLVFCWKPICIYFFEYQEEQVPQLVIPFGTMSLVIGVLLVSVILFVGTKWKANWIIEVLSIIAFGVGIPIIDTILTRVQFLHIGLNQGIEVMNALTTANSICGWFVFLTKLSLSFGLVISGMSIAQKHIKVKMEQ